MTTEQIIETFNEVAGAAKELFGSVDYRLCAEETADILGIPYEEVKEAVIEDSVKNLRAG